VGAAKICQPRDHDTRVGDRLLERREMDAWIAGRVMCEARQRVAIGLRKVLSRDLASPSRPHRLKVAEGDIRAWLKFEVVARFEQDWPCLLQKVGPSGSGSLG